MVNILTYIIDVVICIIQRCSFILSLLEREKIKLFKFLLSKYYFLSYTQIITQHQWYPYQHCYFVMTVPQRLVVSIVYFMLISLQFFLNIGCAGECRSVHVGTEHVPLKDWKNCKKKSNKQIDLVYPGTNRII